MYADLQEFLKALEQQGELLRLRAKDGAWSAILEIAELADAQSKMKCARESATAMAFDAGHAGLGGKAIVIEDVEGCEFPLAINVFGSYRRMEMALGCENNGGFEAIAKKIEMLVKPSAPPRLWNVKEVWRKAKMFLPLLRIAPRLVRSGKCQEVVKLAERGEVDLRRLPLIKCWPADGDPRMVGVDVSPGEAGTAGGGGRYITFGGMHTIHHEDRNAERPASHNIGMYRAQLIDATHLAMHWHMHHDGAAHWRSWKNAAPGTPMPIAICFGGEAVMAYAATAPLPLGMSELLMAGFLNGRGIPMVKAKTVPLRVPANSEVVIEGYVSTECGPPGWDPESGEPLGKDAVFEGPFGDHTGFYSLPDRYPVMTVTAVTHRRNAVFPATVVGIPPQEDYYMGKATERVFLPLLRMLIPDIVDYHLPMFGCFHNCAFIKIRKAYPLQARRVMHAVWGAGQMAWTKMVMVVDEDVDVHDEEAVLRAMMRECDFERDVEMVRGPMDILDHAAPWLGAGSKIGFDCTKKIAGEGTENAARAEARRESVEQLKKMYGERVRVPEFGNGACVFLNVKKERGGAGAEAIAHVWSNAPQDVGRFVVIVDETVDVNDWQSVMFHLCANCDPLRDVHRMQGRLAFDATAKMHGDERNGMQVRQYPPIIKMSGEIKERVRKNMESMRSP